MSDEKKEPIKYKFGESELDLKKYIEALDYNVLSYLNSKKWGDGLKNEFMNAYNQYFKGLKDLLENGSNRFSTDSFGTILDSTGALHDKSDSDNIDPVGSEYYYDNAGNSITSDDYKALKDKKKKDYKSFHSRREVASFFNTVGKALRDKTSTKKETPKEKFDVSKHGFLQDWQKRNGASGEKIDLIPYLNMDVYDETTGKRDRTKRTEYLKKEIDNYLNTLTGDYDFTGSPYTSLDDYKAKLKSLSDKLSDGWSEDDMIAANQAGIGSSFYKDFFTEEKDPSITTLDVKEKNEEAKKKALLESQNKWIDDLLAIYDKNGYLWIFNNLHNLGKVNSKYWTPETGWDGEAFRNSFIEGSPEWNQYYNPESKQFDYQTYFNNYLANPFNSEGKRAIAGLIGMGYARPLQGGKYLGMYYIPLLERDKRTNSGLIYDPLNGRLFYTFIGDIPDLWNRMIEEYKLNNGLIDRRDSYKFKEGGSIEKLQLGGGFDANAWMAEDRQKSLEEKGSKKGRTSKQQEAGDRVAGVMGVGVKDTAQNTNNGFSGTDYLRLGTIAADIVSMGSAFVPGIGTGISAVTGVASSLGTFFADAFEDGLDSGDWGNLATNLGMDVLGLIPGGGSASKGVKIAKNLAKYASRIMATIGAMTTVANSLLIINSFGKLSKPSELTVDDWRNISAGLGLITGGVGAITRKYLQAKTKAANAKPDNVAVELEKDGVKKTVLFSGDDAKAIRTAKDPESIKAVTSKYEDFKDWNVATNNTAGWRGFKNSEGKWQNPIGGKSGKARVFDVSLGYDILGNLTGKTFANRGKWLADIELTSANNPGKTVALVDAEVDAFKKQTLESLLSAGTNFTNARIAARERAAQQHENLLQKQLDYAVKVTPKGYKTPSGAKGTGKGLNKSELAEYKYLQGSEAERRIHLLNLREKAAEFKRPEGYHTSAYKDFKRNYVDAEGNVNLPVPGTKRAIQGTFEELIKDLGIFKLGGSFTNVRKFYNSGKILKAGSTRVLIPEDKQSNKETNLQLPGLYVIKNPTVRYGVPRALLADWTDKEMTDKAISNEKTFLLKPFETHRTVYSDLDAEMLGQKAAATLNSMANRPLTSDAALQTATKLESLAKGQEFITSSKAASNDVSRQSMEMAQLQEKENAKNRHDTEAQNLLSLLLTSSNKNKHAIAYLAKRYEIYDTLGKQFEFDARTKQEENKSYEDAYALSDISNWVTANLADLDPELDPEAVNLYKQVRLGALNASDLLKDPVKWNLFSLARIKASELEKELFRRYKNIPTNRWSGVRAVLEQTPWAVKLPEYKEGGVVAGIKARTKDAERFLKYINEAMKRNEKALDRLSKSVYSYIKASIV